MQLLANIAEWGERTGRFLGGVSKSQFLADELRQAAISKCVEVIGEASGEIIRRYPDFVAAHPQLELIEAYRMRNRLSHGYDTTSWEIMWDTATVYVPRLLQYIRKLQQEDAEL